ncbi:hypothetical protein MKY41_11590 [Sporosarcina sp. FSL W7-1349]|uniref:hypothetical protein n=1 Tax=Sporosarcina sp. FSL W7-1349 TaxID=2921561 RepID=UPI0030FBA202
MTTETNAKQLDKIQQMYGYVEADEFTIKAKDYEWLYRQAERAQILEKALKGESE